jgi:L-ribulose-5-phosphate 3-epimerase UlaE
MEMLMTGDFIDAQEAYRIGLDGVEITLYWLPSGGFSLSDLKRLALLRGLPISCAGISTDFCSPSKSERDRMITKVDEGLKLAETLGAPCLRVFGGQVLEGHIETKTRERVIEALKRCVCLAENQGIVLALENHHGITARADDVIEILERVGSPWLRLNLDLGNYGGGVLILSTASDLGIPKDTCAGMVYPSNFTGKQHVKIRQIRNGTVWVSMRLQLRLLMNSSM